jgi:alpha-1,3-glucosyltransferase
MQLGFYAVMVMWHVLEAFVPPPNGKPDIWVVVNVLIGAAGFTICYAWCTWNLVVQSGLLEEYFRSLEKRRQEQQRHPEAREQAETQMQRKSKSGGKAKAG